MTNQPKLSARAQQALDILANGGIVLHRLERNSFTGRDQFQTRFCYSTNYSANAKGLGFATFNELKKAGFEFKRYASASNCTEYTLEHSA